MVQNVFVKGRFLFSLVFISLNADSFNTVLKEYKGVKESNHQQRWGERTSANKKQHLCNNNHSNKTVFKSTF